MKIPHVLRFSKPILELISIVGSNNKNVVHECLIIIKSFLVVECHLFFFINTYFHPYPIIPGSCHNSSP